MFHPLFDAKDLTDKEIQAKINEQILRIAKARSVGMHDSIINQMQMLLDSYYSELEIRSVHKIVEKLEDDEPCVFDLNSYLEDDDGVKKKNESTGKQIYKSQW